MLIGILVKNNTSCHNIKNDLPSLIAFQEKIRPFFFWGGGGGGLKSVDLNFKGLKICQDEQALVLKWLLQGHGHHLPECCFP